MRVAVTTSADRAEAAAEQLAGHGLEAVMLPCIRIEPDREAGAAARAAAIDADWLILTSPRAVTLTWPDAMPPVRVAAVGRATAEAAAASGGRVELVGDGGSRRLIEKLGSLVAGEVIVFPHAAGTGTDTTSLLSELGADVRPFPVYATVPVAPGPDPVDAAAFGSPSAVSGWLLSRSLEGLVRAAIGETTAGFLTAKGHPPHVVPGLPGYPGLAQALQEWTRERTTE